MDDTATVRKPGVAGTFYSGAKLVLERELSMLLEASPVLDLPRPIRTLISPHAGYLYSGGVAARAYSQIKNQNYKYVAVIAPSHKDSFPFCSIFDGSGFQTPLGEIPLEKTLSKRLADSRPEIRFSLQGHSAEEHSLEVQLPFLQWCLGRFKLIPISMGEQDLKLAEILGRALIDVLPHDESLIVASSDLSHMYADAKARVLDQVAQDAIAEFDEQQLWADIKAKRTEMCGYGPVIAAMIAARGMGARESKILLYRNSGDISGEIQSVVGYLSAILY